MKLIEKTHQHTKQKWKNSIINVQIKHSYSKTSSLARVVFISSSSLNDRLVAPAHAEQVATDKVVQALSSQLSAQELDQTNKEYSRR
jgi:hypothetical protein